LAHPYQTRLNMQEPSAVQGSTAVGVKIDSQTIGRRSDFDNKICRDFILFKCVLNGDDHQCTFLIRTATDSMAYWKEGGFDRYECVVSHKSKIVVAVTDMSYLDIKPRARSDILKGLPLLGQSVHQFLSKQAEPKVRETLLNQLSPSLLEIVIDYMFSTCDGCPRGLVKCPGTRRCECTNNF
jgi:hypothetical protein